MNINSLTIAFFVIGNIIGSGFFMVPSILAPLGMNMLYSWLFAALIAFLYVYIFGRLCVIFPDSNVLSDYFESNWLQKLIAYSYSISCIIGNAGILIVIVSCLQSNYSFLIGTFILLILSFLNYFLNYETIAKIEIILTFLKFSLLILCPLLLFLYNPKLVKFPEFYGNSNQVLKIGISSFWAFLGLESASIFGSGKDARNGLMLGVFSCFVLYLLTSIFMVSVIDLKMLETSNAPFVDLFVVYGFSNLANYIKYLIAFTALGSLYGWIAGVAKMNYSFAKSNLFPSFFLIKNAQDVSIYGLILSSFLTFLIFLSVSFFDISSQFNFVSNLCVYTTLAIYAMCAYSLFKNSDLFDKIISIFSILLVLFCFFMILI